eukprot:scaffold131510_cov23-Tisochrysis_lutea.AAC.1
MLAHPLDGAQHPSYKTEERVLRPVREELRKVGEVEKEYASWFTTACEFKISSALAGDLVKQNKVPKTIYECTAASRSKPSTHPSSYES